MVALVFAVMVSVLAAPAAADAANGSITGKVTEAVGGAGIEGVEVCAWGVEPTEDFGCDVSSADGAYAIEALLPGEYVVEFWPVSSDYIGQWYDGKSFAEEPDPVIVSSGAATPGIDAELEKGGEIEGTVVDNGPGEEPIQGIEVVAFGTDEQEFVGEAVTDADGEYTISRLPEGPYKVLYWDLFGEYVTQYYDGVASWEEADVVFAEPGVKDVGIDAEMQVGGRITGTVTDSASGAGVGFSTVCVRDAFEGLLIDCTRTNSGGGYAIGGLPTGSYKVWFSPDVAIWEIGEALDDYFQQYYDAKSNFAQANPVAVVAPGVVQGINARLVSRRPVPPAPIAMPPVHVPPAVHKPKRPRCPKGKRKVKVKGKIRCVKKHRKHRQGRQHAKRDLFHRVAGDRPVALRP